MSIKRHCSGWTECIMYFQSTSILEQTLEYRMINNWSEIKYFWNNQHWLIELVQVASTIFYYSVDKVQVESILITRNVRLFGQCSIYLELNFCPKSLMVPDAFSAAVPIADCVCLDASSAAVCIYIYTHTQKQRQRVPLGIYLHILHGATCK